MILKYKSPYKLEKKTKGAAAFDLYSAEHVTIPPFSSATISTKTHIALPSRSFGLVTLRSGHGFNKHLLCHVGIIDSDYRGEIKVKVHNMSNTSVYISEGERFAQFTPIFQGSTWAKEEESLDDTVRGEGGFGHTGA